MEKQQLIEIGKRLRKKRKELSLTHEEFAKLSEKVLKLFLMKND